MINLVNPLTIVLKVSEQQAKQKSGLDFNDFLKGSDENDDPNRNQLTYSNIIAEVNSADHNKVKLNVTDLNLSVEEINKEAEENIKLEQLVVPDSNLNHVFVNIQITNKQVMISGELCLSENDNVNIEQTSLPKHLNDDIESKDITAQTIITQSLSGLGIENKQIRIIVASTNQQKALSSWTLIPSYKMDYINSIDNTLPSYPFHFQYSVKDWNAQSDKQNYLLHSSTSESFQVNSRNQFMFHLNDVNIDKINTQKIASKDDLDTSITMQYASTVQNSQWSKFIMRWATNKDGTETIWVRDYSLDAENSQQLLMDIRTMANHSSVQLSRVMINGQEFWLRYQNL